MIKWQKGVHIYNPLFPPSSQADSSGFFSRGSEMSPHDNNGNSADSMLWVLHRDTVSEKYKYPEILIGDYIVWLG